MNKYRLLEVASKVGVRTIKELSATTKIAKSVLSAKLNGHRSFDTEEIKIICDALNIVDGEQKAEIFLR